ncbi:uncharacterized protein STEHIDRAFT_165323 [Stereum hirsutum FP-91666 SS1]|uniref:uncharacterized protein n=1 Tax=Stereum hirsutum (strain FP-91666) TaxID=721885 RepID=UPI000440D6BF|nr:uncharacterized protein STEHIDRAFT_165323 [Stereum hirsutum FP-91666 SS1]EIM90837.1 hypothetical protein STEHIDRAFT_165323 [Stereum hirsutum FP-91666 SS1]
MAIKGLRTEEVPPELPSSPTSAITTNNQPNTHPVIKPTFVMSVNTEVLANQHCGASSCNCGTTGADGETTTAARASPANASAERIVQASISLM